MSKLDKIECYWFAQINDRLLFILKDGNIVDLENGNLIKETYRNMPYYRIEKTNIRVSQKTIKNNAERCNVLI